MRERSALMLRSRLRSDSLISIASGEHDARNARHKGEPEKASNAVRNSIASHRGHLVARVHCHSGNRRHAHFFKVPDGRDSQRRRKSVRSE